MAYFTLKIIQNSRVTFAKYWKKRKELSTQKVELYPVKISFKSESAIETFQAYRAEIIPCCQSCSTSNVKGSPWGRRKMIPNGYMNVQKGIKSAGNSNYMGQNTRYFLII